MLRLIVLDAAITDIQEAYAWYESRQPGLGESLIDRLDECLERIWAYPEISRAIYAEYRRMLVRRFPYAIFYEADKSTITVYAVFHTSQDPEKLRERLT